MREGIAFVCAGAAGGKQQPERIEVDDLAQVTHDPLLASLRQRLRKQCPGGSHALILSRLVFLSFLAEVALRQPTGPNDEGEQQPHQGEVYAEVQRLQRVSA